MSNRPNHLHSVDASQEEPLAPSHAKGGGGNGGNFGERLARLEAQIQHLATKEDIQKIKVWVLTGIIAGFFTVSMLVVAVMRFWPA